MVDIVDIQSMAHFKQDVHVYTMAPDNWKALLSQHQSWINSMVHNLGELIFLEQLCGFCCFSMHFIVMIDLLSTIIQPVSVAYVSFFCYTPHTAIYSLLTLQIIYLLYLIIGQGKSIPTLPLIKIAAVY